MTPKEEALAILDRMADLLAYEECWAQGKRAVSATGRMVKAKGSNAVAWSIVGAAFKVGDGHDYRAQYLVNKAFYRAIRKRRKPAVSAEEWNDAPERKHSEVLEAIAKARAIVESQP